MILIPYNIFYLFLSLSSFYPYYISMASLKDHRNNISIIKEEEGKIYISLFFIKFFSLLGFLCLEKDTFLILMRILNSFLYFHLKISLIIYLFSRKIFNIQQKSNREILFLCSPRLPSWINCDTPTTWISVIIRIHIKHHQSTKTI